VTKHLYRHATSLQEQLLGAALLYPADQWPLHAPRVQLDAWATLWRWHTSGEPMTRMTNEAESAMLSRPLPGDLRLASVALQTEALAVQLPPRDWIVIARHPAKAIITVHGSHSYCYEQPLLTYMASSAVGSAHGYRSGYVSLIDQATVADLQLYAGTLTDSATERQIDLGAADAAEDEYTLALAIHALYTRRA
jgi:hypothetical protein